MSQLKVQFELFIFDLDGTLINSKKDISLAINQAITEMGGKPKSEDELSHLLAQGSTGLLKEVIDSNDLFPQIFARFSELYQENLLTHTKLYPGATKIFDSLQDHKMAIMSNKRERFCTKILEGLALDHLFHPILGGDSFDVKKPHPKPILQACQMAGIEPHKSVMIGDSPVDIQAGRDAGVFTVGISQGFTDAKIMQDSNPDLLIENLNDLLDHL